MKSEISKVYIIFILLFQRILKGLEKDGSGGWGSVPYYVPGMKLNFLEKDVATWPLRIGTLLLNIFWKLREVNRS